jgi:hypothetical protein
MRNSRAFGIPDTKVSKAVGTTAINLTVETHGNQFFACDHRNKYGAKPVIGGFFSPNQ